MVVDAWKNFELSGKVLDYLAYRKGAGQDALPAGGSESLLPERGMDRYGTERGSDGNGDQCHANWRL